MWRFAFIVLLSGFLAAPVFAQDGTWPIEERCATYAPNDSWSYEGTILLTGYAGLHGVNADWETPHVLVFGEQDGVLSPDGNWYAWREKTWRYQDNSINRINEITALRVHSTQGDGVWYTIPWQSHWFNLETRYMFWLDNERLLLEYSEDTSHDLDELFVVNPFENTIGPWNGSINIIFPRTGPYPSPDFGRVVIGSIIRSPFRAIYDLASGDELVDEEGLLVGNAVWTADSQVFAAVHYSDYEHPVEQQWLALFDRNGNLMEIIADLSPYRFVWQFTWSPDGRFLAVIHDDGILLVDTAQRRVIETCLSRIGSLSWSPDSHQLALLADNRPLADVLVFDMDSWNYRAVAQHLRPGRVLGWRED